MKNFVGKLRGFCFFSFFFLTLCNRKKRRDRAWHSFWLPILAKTRRKRERERKKKRKTEITMFKPWTVLKSEVCDECISSLLRCIGSATETWSDPVALMKITACVWSPQWKNSQSQQQTGLFLLQTAFQMTHVNGQKHGDEFFFLHMAEKTTFRVSLPLGKLKVNTMLVK